MHHLGYRVVWYPKYRRPVLSGSVSDRCEELIRARAGGHGWQIVALAGDGAKWVPAGQDGGWARAAFQAVGSVKVKQHRPVRGVVKALQLKREHRRWYLIVIAEAEPVPLPAAGREVGVDVGVARFLTTSDGEVVPNPRFLAASAAVIADLRRRKSRAQPGSGNRKRLRRALAREWRTVRNRPQQKTVICPRCGPHDADVNGARNIATRAGLGSGQASTA
jgi:transposase